MPSRTSSRALLAVLLLAAPAALLPGCPGETPETIVVTPDPIDFGEVDYRGEPRAMDVRLENRGRRDLMVTTPTPSCVCFQVVDAPSGALRAGESVTFRLLLLPSKADPAHPRLKKTISILTDDPARPKIEVNVVGHVIQYWRSDPPIVDLGRVDSRKGVERRVHLTTGRGMNLTVKNAVSSDPRVSVDVVPVRGGVDLVVRTLPGAKAGRLSAQVRLRLEVTGRDRPWNSEELLPVQGEML